MIASIKDIKAVRFVSNNIKDLTKLEPYIEEAELLDVMPVLSPPVYKLLAGQTPVPPDELLISVHDGRVVCDNGGTKFSVDKAIPHNKVGDEPDYNCLFFPYYYDNDHRYSNGLIRAIAYFAYARCLMQANVNLTAIGAMQHFNDQSMVVDSNSMIFAEREARKIASIYLRQVVDLIDYLCPTDNALQRNCPLEVKTNQAFVIGG